MTWKKLVEPAGFEPATSSMPSMRAPNCATAPLGSYVACIFYSIARGAKQARRIAGLFAAAEPAVAYGEFDQAVVAGVVAAQAGAGEVADRVFEEECVAGLYENMRASDQLRSEIHGRSISGRNVVGGEDDATGGRDVRDDFFVAGEIPLPDRGLEAAAVDGACGRKHGVERHDVKSPLEISAKPAGKMIMAENAADAAPGIHELRVVGFAEAEASAGKNAEFPGATRDGMGIRILCFADGRENKREKQYGNNFHDSPIVFNSSFVAHVAEMKRRA